MLCILFSNQYIAFTMENSHSTVITNRFDTLSVDEAYEQDSRYGYKCADGHAMMEPVIGLYFVFGLAASTSLSYRRATPPVLRTEGQEGH